MRLAALISDADRASLSPAQAQTPIASVTADSRAVRAGALFVAIRGERADGHRFIDAAIQAGAAAIISEQPLPDAAIPVLVVGNSRAALAQIAARWYPQTPERVVAITGTNGKTSTAGFVRQLANAQGRRAASIGTLGVIGPAFAEAGKLTTPDPLVLHRHLAELATRQIDICALEASSHGLAQFRLDGVELHAAAFTNLSRDHFDYHGSVEAYFRAKARLFDACLPAGQVAVLNADDAMFADLATICQRRGHDVLDFGHAARRLRLVRQSHRQDGQHLAFELDGRAHRAELSLVGGFQAENVLAALGLGAALGLDVDAMVASLAQLEGAPGRMQLVGRRSIGAAVFVDYAHTPDALRQALTALRPHTEGRLLVVFGAGGDRDPGKRPQMGAVCAELADRCYITDDNPRSEDPARIRAAIRAACPEGIEIGDRAQAIAAAVEALGNGDILLIAGKGHEPGQIIGDMVLPFDDAEVARAALGVGDLSASGAAA
ncbi:MAG: UDP-N-acetylmuramoyl-L-alanyl-D-glutamate--2,6-diaminopimelate ligase [Geminicoccaceae bacterium]